MDGLVIIVNVETGNYYSLNQTASDIWHLILTGKDKEQIITELSNTYSADRETINSDFSNCINKWLKEELIFEKL